LTRSKTLPRAFYARDPRLVAPELLNKLLVHGETAGRIVEVEAYCGGEDPASHAFRGPTARNAVMFGAAGHLYVYFTYGMHFCANAVCATPGVAGAVLLRAVAPVRGVDVMRARRAGGRRSPAQLRHRDLGSGPARLAQALDLDRSHNGVDLVRGAVRIVDDGVPPPPAPGVSPRIGIRVGTEHLWRWFVAGDPNVSRG